MGTIIAILQLLPAVIAVARAIEQAAPVSGAGKDKLKLILDTIEDTYNVSKGLSKEMPKDEALKLITQVVSRVVGFLNALGVFSQKGAGANA